MHPDLSKYLSSRKRIVTYAEGAKMYGMGINRFTKLAKEANANRIVKRTAIVFLDTLDDYLKSIEIAED